jgi:hypothetical protein
MPDHESYGETKGPDPSIVWALKKTVNCRKHLVRFTITERSSHASVRVCACAHGRAHYAN